LVDKREKAQRDYLAGMKYKDITEKYGVSINTVKSWKQRDGWSWDSAKKGAHKIGNATTKRATIARKKLFNTSSIRVMMLRNVKFSMMAN